MPKTMPKTKDKVTEAAANVKPYVDRALHDEQIREDVLNAFDTARQVYNQLIGNRRVTTIASRVATDKDLQDQLRVAIDDLRSAAGRLQGRKERSRHRGRNSLIVAGIALGILFNPVTGSDTRRWLKDLVTGGSDEFGGSYDASENGA